jgi:hypothetical protein
METEVFANSLGSNCISFVKIDNLPLLMLSSVVTVNTNCLTFFVFTSFNIKYFAALPVDELIVLILEYLEPS